MDNQDHEILLKIEPFEYFGFYHIIQNIHIVINIMKKSDKIAKNWENGAQLLKVTEETEKNLLEL